MGQIALVDRKQTLRRSVVTLSRCPAAARAAEAGVGGWGVGGSREPPVRPANRRQAGNARPSGPHLAVPAASVDDRPALGSAAAKGTGPPQRHPPTHRPRRPGRRPRRPKPGFVAAGVVGTTVSATALVVDLDGG